jgi:hypothetical protein
MRYRIGLFAVGIVLLSGSAAWYVRPIIAAHAIGISWRATLRRAHCARGPFDEYCTTNWPLDRDPPLVTTLNIEPWTRTLLRADRTWSVPDSVTWARLVDSTRGSFAKQGLAPLPCDASVTHFPTAEAWHVGSHEIQLYAGPAINVYGVGPRGFLSVQLLPFGGGSCGPRFGRRLLTPDEMGQRIRAWVSEQLGLQ